ncbi:hypothetical protein [uncultured Methylobacterium sp.]|uniref:hypothetical protein n=1 Tax=uncultured Methylobacterium sp. TaxID=157278 RepID=UPI0035CA682F
MTIIKSLALAGTLSLLALDGISAKPCAVGTTTDSTGQKASGDNTSIADGSSTAKVTPGAKKEDPGAVGAMENVGANERIKPDEAKPAEGKVVKQGSDDC